MKEMSRPHKTIGSSARNKWFVRMKKRQFFKFRQKKEGLGAGTLETLEHQKDAQKKQVLSGFFE